MKNYAIILASGSGERTGLDIPKQFVKIAGKSVLEHTLCAFEKNINIDEIIVVTHKNYINFVEKISNNYSKVKTIIEGGETRKDSSYLGIKQIKDENAKVLIHDAVRPFISEKIIDDCINALDKYKAVDVAITSADTIIKINSENIIDEIPQRSNLRRGQTPQAFDLQTIKKAHELSSDCKNLSVTDDCGLVIKFKLADVYVVNGEDSNIKITYPIDITIADKLFQIRTFEAEQNDLSKLKDKTIVIYGGNSGIGKSIANISKQYEANVYTYSRTNGCDIADYNSVKVSINEILKDGNKIDYIINTAGILNYGSLIERNLDEITKEVEVNYLGSINIAKASFEYLKETKGSLLFFASSSYTRGRKNYAIYSSTKAAIVNLTQGLSEEWNDYGIKVNVIVPERTATPMRYINFGNEPAETLLSPDFVAEKSLNILLTESTGQVFNIRKSESKQL